MRRPAHQLSTALMSPLPEVFAYRDDGPKLGKSVRTKWQPRKVWCTTDRGHGDTPGTLHVVKYVREGKREAESAAALTSELVCNRLLRALGFEVLTPAFVTVSEDFIESCRVSGFDYIPARGQHFGTVHRSDVHPEHPTSIDDVADLNQAVLIWVFDTLFMNVDRKNYGNLLWKYLASGKWSPIPADHSDCFDGAINFSTGVYRRSTRIRSRAATPQLLVSVLFAAGTSVLQTAITQIQHATSLLPDVFRLVPAEWLGRSRVEPDEVIRCLNIRADRLPEIIDIHRWEASAHDGPDPPIIGV